jgi:2-desacetyl-2-hydroxyethyl bacteriochlorophyllide A dehydrogenase
MRQAVLEQPGRLVLGDAPPPAPPRPGEALVRVRRVGVCGTDFHAFKGDQPFFAYPRILGHELGVEVVEAPGTAGWKPGDRCALEPYMECGRCVACRRGRTNCCAKLEVLGVHVDGGMRELLTVPLRKLHRSDSLSFEQLALVETLGIGAHAVARAGLQHGETVLVVGTGPIGLAVIQSARPLGVRVMATDVNEARLQFCRERMGVEHTFPADASAEHALGAATRGEMPTVVFEATGNPASMERSFGFVASGGTLVLVGLCPAKIAFADPEFHRREMTLLSSRNATAADFDRVLDAVAAGRLDTRPWVTHRAPLADVGEALPSWARPDSGVLKAIVEIG